MSDAELVATLENDPVRCAIAASALPSPAVNSDGLDADTNWPCPLTAACSRSSMRRALSVPGLEVSGSGQAGLAGTLSTLDQPMVVFRPIEMPNVTMCCQNAGSASVAGTLLLSGLDVFPM